MKIKGGKASHKKLKDLNSKEFTHLSSEQYDTLTQGKNADKLHTHKIPDSIKYRSLNTGGVSYFDNLEDTPSSKIGHALNILQVDSTEKLLEYTTTPTFTGLTMTGPIEMNDNPITNVEYLDYTVSSSPATEPEGRSWWNATDHTLNISTGLGPVLQVGQELHVFIYNESGSTIYNGTAVYPVGAFQGYPSVEEADAATHETIAGDVIITTMDIPTDTMGVGTKLGKVRGLNTSGFSAGDTIWLAAGATGILNNITNVRPEFPAYVIQLGGVNVSDSEAGVFLVETEGKASDTIKNFWNGVFRETFDFRVTSSGGIVTGTLTPQNGHDDMTMIFSDGFTILDTSPSATIELTAGTDSSPQSNYIYIPQNTKVLTKSTTGFPTTEHIKVSYCLVGSASYVEVEGPYSNQNWNDNIENTSTFEGHLTHIVERIRRDGALWFSGIGPNGLDQDTNASYLDIPGTGEVWYKSTAGVVYQLHKHPTNAKDSDPGGNNDDVHVVNWDGDSFHAIQDLTDIIADANGLTLTNRFFNLVFWQAANKTGEYSPIMCNLPTGSYTNQANVEGDVDGFDVLTMPREFTLESGTGFLVARVTVRNISGVWSHVSTIDLRGQTPSTATGGISGTTTSFADNQFEVFNVSDITKVLVLDVGTNVTTGNTRTLQVPDASGIIALTSQSDGTIDHNDDLTTLQGGTAAEYYHLTSTEYGGDWGAKNLTTTGTGNFGGVVSTGDILLDDGTTDSPTLRLRQGDRDEELQLIKTNAGPAIIKNTSASNGAICIQPDNDTVHYLNIQVPGTDVVLQAIGGNLALTTATGSDKITANRDVEIAGDLSVAGDINPEADGTRSLGTQTTAQWKDVWTDKINDGTLSGNNSGDQNLSGYLLNTTDAFTGTLSITGSLEVDTLDFNGNVISDSTGTISFSNENLTTTGTGTFGAVIVDVTSTEALLVRKDGDGGDLFIVDTTNSRMTFGDTLATALNAITFTAPQGILAKGSGVKLIAGEGGAEGGGNKYQGGDFTFLAGIGGTAVTESTGGSGGKIIGNGGAGGTKTITGASNGWGGNGGDFSFYGGAGGEFDGSTTGTATSGRGGNFNLVGGGGGEVVFISDTDNVGGLGGTITLFGGIGGDSVGGGTAGNGGDIILRGGSGGEGFVGSSNGTNGNVRFLISSTEKARLNNDGNFWFSTDNGKAIWGAGQAASIYVDGSDFIINSENIIANDEVHFTNFDAYTFDNTVSTTGDMIADDFETDSTGAFYFGDQTTDGTWKIIRSGDKLVFQRRESGAYVTKGIVDE